VNPGGPFDDDGIFRPRMGRRGRRDRDLVPPFNVRLARTAPKTGKGSRGRRSRAQPGRIAVRAPHARSRRCVIKARYVPTTGDGRKLAARHLAYLERDGVERDGAPGRLYGADEEFSAEAFREPLANEQRQFRFIVSPQDGAQVDLTEFARQLVSQVEKDTGRQLIWAAVNHHDTDNPHVHIVVRGVDKNGDDLRIDGRYLGEGMRWRAQEILTRELGRRSELDIAMERSLDVGRETFTDIDRAITDHSSPEGKVSLPALLAAPAGEGQACLERLQVLEEMQLAKKDAAGVWQLADGWKGFLVQRGEDLDARARLRSLVGDEASRYRVLRQEDPVPMSEGVVVGKGLHNELTGEMFVAIRTTDGKGYYLPVPADVAEALKDREAVRVGFRQEPWLKPADRIVARFAEGNGGIYDPLRHQRELERLPPSSSDRGQPTPEERVTANLRRLERLARYRLVTRLPDGRWQVPPDLLKKLEDRERSHPQHRLCLEKPRSPTREADVSRERDVASEKEILGRALSRQLRSVYVSDPPTFKGQAVTCPPTPSGREYLCIVDGRTGQFTLVAKPPGGERLVGQTVHLTRDPQRGLSLQIDRGISR